MATYNIQTLAMILRDIVKVAPLGCIEEGVYTLAIERFAHVQIISCAVEDLIVNISGSTLLVRR